MPGGPSKYPKKGVESKSTVEEPKTAISMYPKKGVERSSFRNLHVSVFEYPKKGVESQYYRIAGQTPPPYPKKGVESTSRPRSRRGRSTCIPRRELKALVFGGRNLFAFSGYPKKGVESGDIPTPIGLDHVSIPRRELKAGTPLPWQDWRPHIPRRELKVVAS